ncbi:MAG: DUF3987 domain-containing protein [Leptolyngbya sp. UWPOB_LEPTO1]|uniref:DUF3987 domain-containing protein n=1 Tax=Leptolyngbya sp. UWPOB_LEPTO1 TaxID=2815653 RepID=UPI001AC48FBA|nr:DUF3987 domain-containing protein [Leptolyngbya sp. UWPOB_LEPTO1]MBN8563562.1 DUF3987 domain-containing protein [Leptolyngbya sp. UWPOB_LEPTO1]
MSNYSNTSPSSTQGQGSDKFRMGEHVDKLTPVKGKKDKYYCPICGGNDLSVNLNTNAYTCYNGCDRAEVREAIAPWKDKQQEAKPVRPKASRAWTHTDIDGEPSIRTRRVDDGEGGRKIWQEYCVNGQWVAGSKLDESVKEPLKKALALYRHQEIKAAIAEGKTVFFVEGEVCADAMWKLGLPATTSIGGSASLGKYGDYSKLLEGASLVICPDRDQTGVKYAEAVEAMYPGAKWLYAFPESPLWKALPNSGGLDIADWIESGATAEQIVGAVEGKRSLVAEAQQKTNNLVALPTVQPMPISQIRSQIIELVKHNLPESDLQFEFMQIAKSAGISTVEIKRAYDAAKSEHDDVQQLPEIAIDLDALIKARQATIDISEQLPEIYSKPILQLAKWQSLRPECYLFALLAGISGSHRNGTEVVLNRSIGFSVAPNLFVAMCAEASQRKTPVTKATITSPLKEVKNDFKELHQAEMEDWQQRCKGLEKDQEKPPEPQRKIPFFTRTTGEAILRQVSRVPDQPMVWVTDELSSIFAGLNQYRGGRGSDSQDLLEYYDGQGGQILRSEGLRDDVDCLNLAIFGGIQPSVLEQLLGDGRDPDGKWARFIFVLQPTVAAVMPDDSGTVDLQDLLLDLYRKAQALPEMEYTLNREAFKYFQGVCDRLEVLRASDPNQAMRAVWGKSQGRIGKLAINLHIIYEIAAGRVIPSSVIPKHVIVKATQLTYFAAQQIEAIYKSSDSKEFALSSNLLKILELAKSKNDWISARDVNGLYERKKFGWKKEDVQGFFKQLAEMGYGEIQGEKKICFRAFTDHAQPRSKTEEIIEDSQAQAKTEEIVEDSQAQKQKYKQGDEVLYCGRNLKMIERFLFRMNVVGYSNGMAVCRTLEGQEQSFNENDLRPFPNTVEVAS